MISSRKRQLLITLILVFACVPALGAEPNLPKVQLKFEVSNEEQQWQVEADKIGKGPIKPTYVAELFIREAEEYFAVTTRQRVMRMLKTSAGQSMSRQQQDFLLTTETQNAIAQIYHRGKMKRVKGHHHFRLYAVSQEDAKKMAKAFIEALASKVEIIRSYKAHIRFQQQTIFRLKQQILEKEAEAGVALDKFREGIKNVHYLSTEEANETISELNKMLNGLDIELAGMKAKWRTIFEHIERQRHEQERQKEKQSERRLNRQDILLKLEQMKIDVMIEMEVAKARKETATALRIQAEDFCKQMNKEKAVFQKNINDLKMYVANGEQKIYRYNEKLTEPDMELVLPSVYQNKVTIYPVRVDNK